MHVRLWELAAQQRDLVAAWQLLATGWSRRMIAQHRKHDGWSVVHPGVYAMTHAPLTREQGWVAATLTGSGTFLSHASAGECYGIWSFPGSYETVVRRGDGGPRRHGSVLVSHSKELEVTTRDGIPITTPERTIIDLAAHADPARMLREALRLKLTTPYSLNKSLAKHHGRRGTTRLERLNDRYGGIPYSRCRSNAEAKGLEILHDAGRPMPLVNKRVNGEEADLTWPAARLIIEIDGSQYHQ